MDECFNCGFSVMFNIFALQAQTHEAGGTKVQVVDAQPAP